MKVQAIANTDFVHGDITAHEGKIVRHRDGNMIDAGLAGDLERAGLVRIRQAREATEQPPSYLGKARDDGPGQPSSSSPAAPVSRNPTSSASRTGNSKIPKADT